MKFSYSQTTVIFEKIKARRAPGQNEKAGQMIARRDDAPIELESSLTDSQARS
jgi:hypothetical protein